jgi:nucleoside-diphosphate-sugar epimerase
MNMTENKMRSSAENEMVVLVTGGSGFLGNAIVEELLDIYSPLKAREVRIFDLVEPQGHTDARIKYIKGDVRDHEAVRRAVEGVDVVIHSAAVIDWGTLSEEELLAVNAGGTENVIRACQENNVKAVVYTSSLDAVYSGKQLLDVDESLDYPERHETVYCRSKYLGELAVREASANGLKTCSLRPSDIYGERDPYHMGSLINMAKGGFYVRIGNGLARTQHVYVYNIAYAHLQAAEALLNGNTDIQGQSYFITDGPGTNFFKFFDHIVEGAGYRTWPKNLWIPRRLAYSMGSISEAIAWMIRPIKKYQPKFSRFAVTYTCTNYTFSSAKAERDFGFRPKYTEEEAIERTVRFYRLERERNK